jgi:hypothetical protein
MNKFHVFYDIITAKCSETEQCLLVRMYRYDATTTGPANGTNYQA